MEVILRKRRGIEGIWKRGNLWGFDDEKKKSRETAVRKMLGLWGWWWVVLIGFGGCDGDGGGNWDMSSDDL